MTWKVRVTVKGYQSDVSEEPIEVVSKGECRFQSGKYYILYEEIDEGENGDSGITRNMLKIEESGRHVELVKKGVVNAVMVFDQEQAASSFYETPYGKILMEINTYHINFINQEDKLEVELGYILNMNHQPVSKNRIAIIAERVS